MINLILSYIHVGYSSRLEINFEDIVVKKIAEWHAKPREKASYSKSELFLHKKIWDALNCDEAGRPKEHSFVDWCKNITKHCNATTSANALTPAMRCIKLRKPLQQRKQQVAVQQKKDMCQRHGLPGT